VGELVAEIAAASEEQARGIDQVNVAVTEMDKVTQSNAANAEESASASEEMRAQAEQMKEMVGELIALVGGGSNRKNELSRVSTGRLMTPQQVIRPMWAAGASDKRASSRSMAFHQAEGSEPRAGNSVG